ncbi:PREDICTED: fatty acyl-CoA reductase 2-like [Erythranthe guttata]|nr:PREDICTED: fatty acyl-CoA reductase 2-like [Erythranthe guttata]|eukprot:XP_012829365.1 PREDICTED: fatty acyl-CoA reductase 2-like [Erythranthe guttata]
MSFAKTCKNLELLVHISTAYVNGEKEGIILEKPLIMGENRRNDICETSQFPRLNIADEVNMVALSSRTASSNYDMTKDMKKLGMERANLYGWYNTYHLTKAMAEMVINETRGDIPVVIIRPTVIESCYKEPIPGWIQGNRMFDPVIVSYGRGQLPAFLGKPDSPMDVIPLDIVVNGTIAAIAKHGYIQKPELNVYHMSSSVTNPLRYSEFFEYLYEYFSSEPLVESESLIRVNYYDDIEKIKYFDNFNDFSKYTREEISRRVGGGNVVATKKAQTQCRAKIMYAENLCKMYEFVGLFKARFHAGNTQKLLYEMSKEEQINFDLDVTKIEWRKYFQEVHIPGLRKHVLNERSIYV